MKSIRIHWTYALVALCLLMIWLFPESDPVWWKGLEDVHDEFWWAENARRKILFDTWMWDHYAGALASGPFSVIWHYLSFRLFGIHFFSLRLVALIPATLIAWMNWRFNPFQVKDVRQSTLLLLSAAGFYAIARIGYIEMMLLCHLVALVVLLKSTRKPAPYLASIVALSGCLFKGSFLLMLLPVIAWFLLEKDHRQSIYRMLLLFLPLAGLAYFTWFYPNQVQFQAYIAAFQADSIPWHKLIDPRGWIARIVWLPTKEWISAPGSLLLMIGLLPWLWKGKSPGIKGTALGLSLLVLLFALPSDFNDRRLTPLLLLLPLLNSKQELRDVPKVFLVLLGTLLSFSAIPYVWQMPKNSGIDFLLHEIPWMALIVAATLAIIAFVFQSKAPLLVFRIGIICFISSALLFQSRLNATIWSLSSTLILLLSCMLILGFMLVALKHPQWQFALLFSFQLGLIGLSHLGRLTFSERDTAIRIASKSLSGEVCAALPALKYVFLSQSSIPMYSTRSGDCVLQIYETEHATEKSGLEQCNQFKHCEQFELFSVNNKARKHVYFGWNDL